MFRLVFKWSATKVFKKLSPSIRDQILKKLYFYSQQKNPLQFAERLENSTVGQWRFRIGDYRAIFDVIKDKIVILKIGHRKDIYR